MATYRIVCTNQEPVHQPKTHAHIVAVGTGADATKADRRWSLAEVILAIDRGDTFYTQGVNSGKVARVEKSVCAFCPKTHIRSSADAVMDNNLDSLRTCNW